MRIAMSGASGLIGSKLTGALRQHGHAVLPIVRDGSRASFDSVFWNPSTRTIDLGKLEKADVVIHLAGKPFDEERWTPKVKAEICTSRIQGTAFLSDALARLRVPPRLLISASASDYYAFNPAPTGEDEGIPGTGFVSEMCQAWERATEPAEAAGIRVVHIRIPSVLASDGHGMLTGILPLFRLGLGPVLGSGTQIMCFVTRDDLGRAIEHIMAHEELHGAVNVSTPEPVTYAEFASTLSRILKRPRFMKVSGPLLRMAMGEVADALVEGDANLRPTKLTATGFQFLYPDIESALRHELGM